MGSAAEELQARAPRRAVRPADARRPDPPRSAHRSSATVGDGRVLRVRSTSLRAALSVVHFSAPPGWRSGAFARCRGCGPTAFRFAACSSASRSPRRAARLMHPAEPRVSLQPPRRLPRHPSHGAPPSSQEFRATCSTARTAIPFATRYETKATIARRSRETLARGSRSCCRRFSRQSTRLSNA